MQLADRRIARVQASFSHMPQQECLEGWLGWNWGPRCFHMTSPAWWPQISYVMAQTSASQSSKEGGRGPNAFLTQPGKSHSVTSIIISYLKQSPTSLDSRGEEVEHNSRGEGFQRICGHLLKHPCLVPACVGKGTLIIALQEGLLSAQAPSWVLEDKGNHMVWGQQREHLLKVTWQREKK